MPSVAVRRAYGFHLGLVSVVQLLLRAEGAVALDGLYGVHPRAVNYASVGSVAQRLI